MLWDFARAAAVLQGHFMNAICMENEEGRVTWNGTFAKKTGMVELDFEAN